MPDRTFLLEKDGASAAEQTCTVEVSVRTEENVLTKAEVSVGDENGDGRMTVEDVLIAAHDKYYEGGAAAGGDAFDDGLGAGDAVAGGVAAVGDAGFVLVFDFSDAVRIGNLFHI